MATTLTPYLSFGGTTREAFAFYEKALGAQIQAMLSYDDVPAPPPDSAAESCGGMPAPTGAGIMHASLVLPGGAMLFAGDVPPGVPFNGIQGAMLALQYDSVEEAETAFAALAEGGQITMALAPAFWSKTFGMLTDRFGVSWAVNGEALPLPS